MFTHLFIKSFSPDALPSFPCSWFYFLFPFPRTSVFVFASLDAHLHYRIHLPVLREGRQSLVEKFNIFFCLHRMVYLLVPFPETSFFFSLTVDLPFLAVFHI